jgi:hypothetical protein
LASVAEDADAEYVGEGQAVGLHRAEPRLQGDGPTLPALGTLNLNVTLGAPVADAHGTVHLKVRTDEGLAQDVYFGVSVEPLRPRLVALPGDLSASMRIGGQSIVEFDLVNAGGKASGPITLSLPNVPWMSLATTNPMPALAPGETNRVTVLLTPSADLPLGPYTGNLAANTAGGGVSIPFNFRAVSESKGDLRIEVVDEFTYYAEGAPRVAGATVTVRDAVDGRVVGSGVTLSDGYFTAADLPAGYYDIEVLAREHSSFRGSLLIRDRVKIDVQAFLSRTAVTYNWTVEPVELEDRYRVIVETIFEAAVPTAVVTITPASIDLASLEGTTESLELIVENRGLVAAQNFRLAVGDNAMDYLEPLMRDLGTLPAQSRIVVPISISRVKGVTDARASKSQLSQAPGNGDAWPCSLTFGGQHEVVCGNFTNTYWTPVHVWNSSCSGPPTQQTPPYTPPSPPQLTGWDVVITPPVHHPRAEVAFPSLCGPCDEDDFDPTDFLTVDFSALFKPAADALEAGITAYTGKLVTPEIEVSARGGIRTCCERETTGLQEFAQASATLNVGVGPNIDLDLEDLEELEDILVSQVPEFAGAQLQQPSLVISAKLRVGVRAGPEFKFEGEYSKGCFADKQCPVEANGELNLQFFGGVVGKLTVEMSIPGAPVKVLEFGIDGSVNGKVGTGVAYKNCEVNNYSCSDGIYINAYVSLNGNIYSLFGTNADGTHKRYYLVPAGPPCKGNDSKGGEGGMVAASAVKAISGDKVLALGMASRAMRASDSGGGGVCARVKLQTEQEAVLARDGFLAQLEILNEGSEALDDVEVILQVMSSRGVDHSDMFSLGDPAVDGIVMGPGIGGLSGGQTGRLRWLIRPHVDAAPLAPVEYVVRGLLRYKQGANSVSVPLQSTPITVLPSPRLSLKYFHERDVFSDDPFTPDLEPSVPYNLAVLIQNRGQGRGEELPHHLGPTTHRGE